MRLRLPHYNEEHHVNTNNFLWLFIALTGLLIFPAIGFSFGHFGTHVFEICYSLVVFTGIYIVTDSRNHLRVGILLGLLTLVSFWTRHSTDAKAISVTQVLSGLVYFSFFVGFHLVRFLLRNKIIDINVIYAAMVGYMLTGIIGGQLCALLEVIQPGSFSALGQSATTYSYIYFSFVTLTTLGYGDIIPQNEAARAIAILIAIAGQIYLTTLIAILIGKYLSQNSPP